MKPQNKKFKKFNFWEAPTDNNEVEKIDSTFFKSIDDSYEDIGAEFTENESRNRIDKEKFKKQKNVSETQPSKNLGRETEPLQKGLLDDRENALKNELDCKELIQDLFDSHGSQWRVLLCFAEKCLETGTLSTGYIKISHIAKQTNIEEKTIYTAIYRLEKDKKLIIRQKGKEGAGGKSRFSLISDKVKNYILSHREGGGVVNINTSGLSINPGQDEWNNINIEPLIKIGFSEKHIIQLKKHSTPQILQESINHFAFGLINNEKTKKYENPLAVFIGVIRKGEAWIEPNYKSTNELYLEKILAAKKSERDRQKTMEGELKDLMYAEWLSALPEKELLSFVSETDISPGLPEKIQKIAYRKKALELAVHYFDAEIWPLKQKEFIKENEIG